MTFPLRFTLAVIVTALSWIYGGGFSGVVTLALYLIGVAPGLPLGFALFGRRQAAGWVAGALIGYALLAFAFWIPVVTGHPRPVAFVLAWGLLLLLATAAARACKGPLVVLPEWTRRDSAALLLVLHLVPIIVGSPFARTGERDETGTQYYRAYFTADFVWHMALTHEVARFEPHLKNPYVAGEDLHYYWTYFLPAAVFATRGTPNPSAAVDGALKTTAMMTALLLLSMIYIAAWAATGRRWAAIMATGIAVLAPSFEGLYALNNLRHTGAPWGTLRELNIDAVSRWSPSILGFRIDNVPRTMWWTPQHGASCALALIAVVAVSRWTMPGWKAGLLTGLSLALSVAFNPLVGGVFCLIYGATAAWDVLSRRMPVRNGIAAAAAGVPVGLALWWCVIAGMSEGAGALSLGLHEYAQVAPFTALFLSLGGVLIPAAVGLLPSRHVYFRPALPALFALVAGLLLMHYVSLTDTSWVGFRAGNIILVTIAMLVARALVVAYNRSGRVLAMSFAAVIFITGIPTTGIDWFNARDLENRAMGPTFLWVVPFTPDQQAGYDWVRRATASDAIVQADPIVRGRQNWSGIPSFTGRRMAAGLPLSLLPDASRDAIAGRVHQIFTELPPEQARAEAHAMGMAYLWIDDDDRHARTGASLNRLLTRPDLFPPMFQQGATVVLAVAR